MALVEQVWSYYIKDNSMWVLQQKLKILSRKHNLWFREIIGNVNEQVNKWENKMLELEELDLDNNNDQSRENLHKGQAEYTKGLGIQETLLKQKTHIKWAEEGDNNTKYFHNIIRDKTRRLQLHRIKNHNGRCVKGNDSIVKEAIHHFEHIFNLQHQSIEHAILDIIPMCVNQEDNIMLANVPDMEEIKEAIISMSACSKVGPDAYNGHFYHQC